MAGQSNLRKGWRGIWKQYPSDSDVSDVVDVRQDYGAVGDGSTDDTAAFTQALASGYDVFVPSGTFMVNNLTMTTRKSMFGLGRASILKKNGNGPILTMARDCDISDLAFDGNGNSYTGTGVTIPATNEYEGEQRLINLDIYDTASYCVEYTGFGSGFGSTIQQCVFNPLNYLTTACIKLSGLEPLSNNHGDRSIIGCLCNGPIVDASSSNVTYITNCFSGDSGSVGPIICDQYTGKLIVTGGRLVGPLALKGYDITIDNVVMSTTVTISDSSRVLFSNSIISGACTVNGDYCKFSNCWFANGITINGDYNSLTGCANDTSSLVLSSGASYNKLENTHYFGGTSLTDNSGLKTNFYEVETVAYTPTWTGTGGTPSVGTGGTLSGRYSRRGQTVTVTITMQLGTGATVAGITAWRWSLPFAPSTSREYVGSAVILDSGTSYYGGACRTQTGASTLMCFGFDYVGATGNEIGVSTPFTWGTSGDRIDMTVTYDVN